MAEKVDVAIIGAGSAGLSALRDAARQLSEEHKPGDLSLCESCPESPLC